MANSIIEVSGLCKSYSSFQLQDISFSLAEGCIMGLIGENGAGKTTTLKALLDIVRPDSGESPSILATHPYHTKAYYLYSYKDFCIPEI